MIEYVMLIMLGFFAGGLVAVLIAPTLWSRAVRLTTRRLEASLPMSVADIESDKDLLRASYAVEMRRLEAALDKAREKSAAQLVEISRLQMEIGSLREQMAALAAQLDERSNAANVFEKTVRKRLPELETQLAAARAALEERGAEITELVGKLRRKDEALALAQEAASLLQTEIRQLREGLEASGADRTGRFKRRPAQWTLEEYRSEYDRLNVELSKMREQLALAYERESNQAQTLKTEMQQLAERIMTSVAAQARHDTGAAREDSGSRLGPGAIRDAAPRHPRPADRPLAAPKPWPKESPAEKLSSENMLGNHRNTPSDRQKLSSRSDKPTVHSPVSTDEATGQEKGAVEMTSENSAAVSTVEMTSVTEETQAASSEVSSERPARKGFSRMSMNAPVTAGEGEQASKTDNRAALKTLLDRKPAPAAKDENGQPASLEAMFGAPATQEAAAQEGESGGAAGPEAIPAGVSLASLVAQAAVSGSEAHDAAAATGTGGEAATGQEAQVDRMLREIFESHSGAAAHDKAASAAPGEAVLAPSDPDTETKGADDEAHARKGALLDRLRTMKERQTG